jgi:endo-1,4-beta-xylanase
VTAASAQTGTTTASLRQLADRRSFLIGAAVQSGLLSEPNYASTLAAQFNVLVAENDMKFESTEPREGKFDFAKGDKIVAFAQKHKMQVRGHTLVWHTQVPSWVREDRCKDAEKILKTHVTSVANHFKGKIFAWDVVNEGIDDDGNLRDTFWARCIGPNYIEKAFRWAHDADPNAQLFYNDYGIERDGVKAKRVFDLVSALKKKGVPIHGVGLQMHLDGVPSDMFLGRYMNQFEEIGLEVHITEMDVRLREPAGTQSLALQAEAYKRAIRRCLQAKNCTALVMWGFTDKYSWVPQFFDGYGSALIFDKTYKPKLAYRALLTELGK